MSSFMNKLKGKTSSNKSDSNEQRFGILPHPAKSNNPADLQEPPQPGGGLNSKPEHQAFHARDPYVPSQEIRNNLPEPASRDELSARSAQLNK